MSATARIDTDDVLAELTLEMVVDHYGLARTDKPKARLSVCPGCGATSSSTAIVINFTKQVWGHFGRGKREGGRCYGGPLDLIAAREGLDRRRDFAKVLAVAAQLAGVTARELTDEEREQRRQQREQRNAERAAQAAADDERRLHDAKWIAAGEWHRLIRGRLDVAGVDYLRSRGVDETRLLKVDAIRFDDYGNVCVPLWGFDGDIVNVVRRRVTEGEPKAYGLKDCPTAGTLIGRIQDISSASTLVCEGVTDSLTALHRWPGRLVLGAHGAGQLVAIVAAAAPRVRGAGGKLVLVPDADDIGQRQMIRAGEAALDAGLVMDRTLMVLEVAPYRDLNEAHCKGWKL